jgi:hypothetical protein
VEIFVFLLHLPMKERRLSREGRGRGGGRRGSGGRRRRREGGRRRDVCCSFWRVQQC